MKMIAQCSEQRGRAELALLLVGLDCHAPGIYDKHRLVASSSIVMASGLSGHTGSAGCCWRASQGSSGTESITR